MCFSLPSLLPWYIRGASDKNERRFQHSKSARYQKIQLSTELPNGQVMYIVAGGGSGHDGPLSRQRTLTDGCLLVARPPSHRRATAMCAPSLQTPKKRPESASRPLSPPPLPSRGGPQQQPFAPTTGGAPLALRRNTRCNSSARERALASRDQDS